MMSDLIAFLTARLDEDEAAAKKAAQKRRGPWHYLGDKFRASVFGVQGFDHGHVAETFGVALAAHIARHDPARVLREVGAKRAIIGTHESPDWQPDGQWGPCHTLRQLAAAYSDHPDYQQEWRP
jgi:hypothetical protein